MGWVIKAAVQLLYLRNNFYFSFLMFHYCSLFSSFHGYCNRLLIGIYLEITMVMALVKVHFVKVFMKIPYDANFRKKICCLVALRCATVYSTVTADWYWYFSLQYTALLRLPGSMPTKEKKRRVNEIIDDLDMRKCLNTSECQTSLSSQIVLGWCKWRKLSTHNPDFIGGFGLIAWAPHIYPKQIVFSRSYSFMFI